MAQSGSPAYVQLSEALHGVDGASFSDAERNELVVKLREALTKVESPWQQLQNMIWENSGYAAALKTAHDIDLFKNWVQAGGETASLEQLCTTVKQPCDPVLLDRIMSALAVRGTVVSPRAKTYSLTAFSRALSEPTMGACLDYWFAIQIPALTAVPEFLRDTGYKLPADPMRTAWNHATKDPTPFFGWLQQRPQLLATFAQVMAQYSASQPPWVDIYPSETLLLEEGEGASDSGSRPDRPLVVDVGGSQGHNLLRFVAKHHPPAGSCYLQDRPEVVEKVALGQEIVAQGIDFFKEQPVKGARAYYLRSVLHDWSDEQCRDILVLLKGALEKDSRILIHELIRPDDGSRDLISLGEWTVLAILGSPERTETQWNAVVESAGLKVAKIHTNPMSLHSILEVVLP